MYKKTIGRNDPCPCGSGKKYKHCCMHRDQRSHGAPTASPPARLEQARAGRKATYPSPAKRKRILRRREELMGKLIATSVMDPMNDRRFDRLVRKYSLEEVIHVLSIIQEKFLSFEFIGEDATIYRKYRRTFARFGGDRPFLSRQEYEEFADELAQLSVKRQLKPNISRPPKSREQELTDLLLLGVELWEDITPPAPPPRPDDFEAPPPGDYGYPVRTLLKWGLDADEQRITDNAKNAGKWRPAIDDLVRMVLDEGLMNGWPGEAPTWAPYHALRMLGHLRAHEVAGRLFPLLDRENEWLSDRLPVVWGLMGPRAEPPLWAYLEDRRHGAEQRGIVLLGLATIAERYHERRADIVNKLASLLQRAPADDAEANAYVVHILDRMHAVEATEAIAEAFEQGKVDTSIIGAFDIDFLGDWEE